MKKLIISCGLVFFLTSCQEKKKVEIPAQVTSNIACATPIITDKDWYSNDRVAPLFENLGNLHFPISTDNELVQKYFDQGLTLAYGFNHAEAARSFYYASKLDPNCAMAHWGFAYVLGPNYNAGMESDNYERAYDAIQKALNVPPNQITKKERDMIVALSKRYVKEPIEDRLPLDIEYSDAMKALYFNYPDDPDIGALYVESLMNLHPWNLFDKDGNAREWTPEIITHLESILAKHPNHCGAHHFYIHAVEASNTPERGLASAQLFDDGLVPNSGHLVHMPSHIYIRTGDYHKGTLANIQAVKVDSTYVTTCHAQGAYPLGYYPHNRHFLAATAALEGNSKWALFASDEIAKSSNTMLMKEPGWGTIQHYYTIPFYVYVKFGKWDEILKMENKVPDLDYPKAINHYAKGMAYLGKNELDKAKMELQELSALASKESLKEVTIWSINTVYDLTQIAEKALKAEVLARENNYNESIKLLQEAIAIEDALNYNEPPDWFFSVRHNLGAIQLKAGLNEDAVQTYLEDLKRLPKNGWALSGLSIAYYNLSDLPKFKEAQEKFKIAWATADVELNGSIIK